ncbi:MAG: hypothetical protein ABL904_21495 [Hyphomicrobiaceae bacterium]
MLAEHQNEQPQRVCRRQPFFGAFDEIEFVTREFQRFGKIKFEVVFRDRQGALEVEAPFFAVGEDAEANLAGRLHIDTAEVLHHLHGWHAILMRVAFVGAVQGAAPTLGLSDCKAVLVALPLIFFGDCAIA